MGRYIARRLLWVLLVVLLVTFFTFVIFFVIPPVDPAILFAGVIDRQDGAPRVTENCIDAFDCENLNHSICAGHCLAREIVLRCLAKSPEARFQSAAELEQALSAAQPQP